MLNTKGRIWVGSDKNNYGRPWQFAQFGKDCLEVSLWILDLMKSAGDQANPVEVKWRNSLVTSCLIWMGIVKSDDKAVPN